MRFFVAAAAVLVVAACSQGGYPPEAKTKFMEDCGASGQQAMCDCIWKELTAQVPYAEFQALEAASKAEPTATPDPKLTAAAGKVMSISFQCMASGMTMPK